MTTPAGWYDDGSGNRRWWDGEQWTAHVVAGPQPAADEPAEEPALAVEQAALAASTAPAAASETAANAQVVDAAAHAAAEPFAPPFVIAGRAAYPGSSLDAPTSTYPGTHFGSYPAGEYPAPGQPVASALTTAPAAPRTISVLGLIGLIAAAVGVVLACIPPISAVGWIVLGLAFVASIVSLFLRGSKWPGITGVGVTVIGAILAVAVSLVSLGFTSIVEAGGVQATPSERPSADDGSSTDDGAADPAEDPSEIEGARMVSFDRLAVGDCIPLVEYEDEIFEVPVVSCDRPHTDEVYFISQFDDGEYPGDDVLYQAAEERCLAEFEGFVGMPYEQSELDFYTYWPTQMSWNRMDDRTVHCIVFSYDDVTGTLQGAGR